LGGASQLPLGNLQRSPDLLAGFCWAASWRGKGEGRELAWEEREGRGTWKGGTLMVFGTD